MMTSTPTAITRAIKDLCRSLAPTSTPIFLTLHAESDATPLECFGNVDRKIQRDGGSRQNGWTVWEWPNVLVEAEFHCVWRSPDSDLVDITPKPHGEERTLFLPDPSRTYTGGKVDNKRKPLRQDKLIMAFIASAERMYEIQNAGPRAFASTVSLSTSEALELAQLKNTLAFLGNAMNRRQNDTIACPFCESRKKFRHCCGKHLVDPAL